MPSLKPLMATLLVVWTFACVQSPATGSNSLSPSVDRDAARQLSDAIVDDFINDRRKSLRGRMESGFQQYYSEEAFNGIVDATIQMYGKPIDAEYKMDEEGFKTAVGYNKPLRKFWYSARTSTYEKGKIFITVEIVPAGTHPAGSGVMMVTFPPGEIPENLR